MIDTHLHIWEPQKQNYSWLKDAPNVLNRDYTLNEFNFLRVKTEIKHAILVQAANNVEETFYLLEHSKNNSFICGVVGWGNLLSPKEFEIQLQNYKSEDLKGIRHLINIESDVDWIMQSNVLDSLEILTDKNLSFDYLGTTLRHLKHLFVIAKRFPSLRIIVDHLNQPADLFNPNSEWKNAVLALKDCENVYFKISGLGTSLNLGLRWTPSDIYQHVSFFLANFHFNRILLGSDWPICNLAGSLKETLFNYTECINQFDNSLLDAIIHKNAIDAYRLKLA